MLENTQGLAASIRETSASELTGPEPCPRWLRSAARARWAVVAAASKDEGAVGPSNDTERYRCRAATAANCGRRVAYPIQKCQNTKQ